MTKRSYQGRADCDPHQVQSKTRVEANRAMKHQQSSSSSGPQAAKKTWKRYLTFLSKFQNKVKHKIKPDAKAPIGLKQGNPKRSSSSPLLEECNSLVHVVRRTAAGCFAAAAVAMASGGSEDEQLPSYVQLDQLSYGVKREAFGPVYLVT